MGVRGKRRSQLPHARGARCDDGIVAVIVIVIVIVIVNVAVVTAAAGAIG